VVEPRYIPPAADPLAELRRGLQNPIGTAPLSEQVRPGERVAIVVNDITRATPSPLIVQAILAELPGIPPQDILLFNALGTHRPNTESELRLMLGDALFAQHRLVQNNAFDPSTQVSVGRTGSGNEIWLNRELMDCDLKILTGFIEPHFFAGFSGGGKALMPGMAGQASVLRNHCARSIADPRAVYGRTQGNPIYEEVMQAARLAGRTFLVNVTLNREKAITRVFAGDLAAAHAEGCAFARQAAMVEVAEPFDIVVTTNSGYPLDLNLYQAVKGMSAAALVVKEGGAILVAAECWDGIPEHGLYGQLLREGGSPQGVLDGILDSPELRQDQWQAQIQAQIQLKAKVYVHSRRLSPEQIRGALLELAPELDETLALLVSAAGSAARICVLPEGPVTIPYGRSVSATDDPYPHLRNASQP
jgi:nickel-dependent lactate racemase